MNKIEQIDNYKVITEDRMVWDKRIENKVKCINPITKLETAFMVWNKEMYYPTGVRNTDWVFSNG